MFGLLIGGAIALILIVALVVCAGCSVMTIGDGYVVIVERFGTFERILRPGLHMIYPLIESVRRVNWHFYEDVGYGNRLTIFRDYRIPTMERIYDPAETEAITKDRIKVFIDMVVHYTITDPKTAVYGLEDLYASIESLIETSVLSVISHITLNDAIEGAGQIEKEVREEIGAVEKSWGITVRRIRIQKLRTTDAIMSATEAAVQAEREAHARCIRERAEADANASQAESRRRIAAIEWETDTLQSRAEMTRERERVEGRAEFEARALEIRATAEASAAELRTRAESARMLRMIEAGATLDYLTEGYRTSAFEAFARNVHRGDMLVPYEFAKVFGNPISLRKNV